MLLGIVHQSLTTMHQRLAVEKAQWRVGARVQECVDATRHLFSAHDAMDTDEAFTTHMQKWHPDRFTEAPPEAQKEAGNISSIFTHAILFVDFTLKYVSHV